MTKGIFIVGSDTNVGKTVVSAGLLYLLRRRGFNACYFKPILSGAVYREDRLIPGDTEFVKHVAELYEDNALLTPFSFKAPLSPHLAARLEGKSIDVKIIKNSLHIIAQKYDYIIAEGCGGLAVPLNEDFYMLYDFLKEVDMNIILVTRSGLGTINHTTLTVKYAQHLGLKVKGIIVNGYEGTFAEDDNIAAVQKTTKVPVLAVIESMENIDTEKMQAGKIKEVFEKQVDIQKIFEVMGDMNNG
ncbi:dethiobiotin synthase [Aceticella autotrophica]|uniref:ATP-dependent dethiobiotin synthetase BioD n=1 Tax=Aceticella autotrophica TaxID=2755338 RepID=A0A975AWG2_9THEO|nr:dethiobiotin synthase [Aceticella autotrophica]QSZ27719.1 dethiobiotin synthase [Aceticella autotrophica]